MLTEEQLAMRKTGLGASEIAAVVGVSRYRKPIDVWTQKLGITPETPTSAAMELGNLLEPVIIGVYSRTVAPATRWTGGTLRHPRHPIILATPDAERDDHAALVEAKYAGSRQRARWGESGTDEVPDEYLLQVQIQCAVTGHREAHIAVFLDGEFRHYVIPAHRPLVEGVIEHAERWWRDHVEARVMPEVDGSDRAREAMLALWPRERTPLEPWPAGAVAVASELAAAKRAKAEAEAMEAEAANHLRALIGDRAGFDGDGYRATWKANGKGAPDWKAIALHAGATPELIAQHTRQPARVLRLHGFGNEE